MSGSLYANDAKLSKAYAAGMDAEIGAVNPHTVGSPAYEAWAEGYAATDCDEFAGSARCGPGGAGVDGHAPPPSDPPENP